MVAKRVGWGGGRNETDGYRDYWIKFFVESFAGDGPQTVTFASGLPFVGQPWNYGNDFDSGAYCTPFIGITQHGPAEEDGEPFWILEYKFTSRPRANCQDYQYDNPVLRPPKVSGSFIERSIKVRKDKDGEDILTTSHELVEVQETKAYPVVQIEQYGLDLGLSTFSTMVNGVNDAPLWGLAARTVKLSNVSWQKLQWGSCFDYYTRFLDFEINFSTWDHSYIPNKGQKMIRGAWVYTPPPVDTWLYSIDEGADADNPTDYIDAYDPRGSSVENWLDPDTGAPTDTPNYLDEKKLRTEHNFLTLGIPTSF